MTVILRSPDLIGAVLSEAKEGSPQFLERATAGILRFAQNDSVQEFLRSL